MVNPILRETSDEYYFEEGRRFNSSVKYILPSDEKENVRLIKQHICHKIIRNGNYLAPVQQQLEEGIHVLGSACGHGAPWTVDTAKEYAKSKYFGVDISDGLPSKYEALVNTRFSIGNITKAMPSLDNTFGFVFQRLLFAALSSEEWNSNLRELYRVLKPRGFIELVEFNLTPYNAGPLFTTLTDRVYQAFENKGLVVHISTELSNRLKDVGFLNCVTTIHDHPMNHSKNGKAYWESVRGAYRGVGPALAELFEEWEDGKVYDKYLDDVGEELIECKSYIRIFTTYAQKP